MQELGYPQPQSYSLAVWGQWCHHNFLSSSSWALFQQRSPRPASHTVYPEGPVPKPDTLRGVSAPCLRSSLKWTLGSLDWHLQQELMSLRTMEDQGGQLGGESGSAWPGPNLPAVADTYSLGFSAMFVLTQLKLLLSVYKLMMISSHKNNTCGLKSQQENKSDLNPPKKETPPELTGYSQRDRVCICKTIIIFSIQFGEAKMVAVSNCVLRHRNFKL